MSLVPRKGGAMEKYKYALNKRELFSMDMRTEVKYVGENIFLEGYFLPGCDAI